jgi:2-iminobutanoate/2-iminopropanoate deaminase
VSTAQPRRQSINTGGFSHANPIPAASRIGDFVASGAIVGRDPLTGELPESLEEQCRNVFLHLREIVASAGGTTDDILKVNVWLVEYRDRAALNREWEAMFPEPTSRPARQAYAATLDGGVLLQADFTAVLPE